MRKIVFLGLLLAAVASCGLESKPQRKLSKAERDSLIGESALPGAVVVKGAIGVDKDQVKRAAEMDSLYDALGH